MIYGLCSELSSLTLDFEMMWFSSNWKEKLYILFYQQCTPTLLVVWIPRDMYDVGIHMDTFVKVPL